MRLESPPELFKYENEERMERWLGKKCAIENYFNILTVPFDQLWTKKATI